MKNKVYTIKEYSYFASDKYVSQVTDGNVLLPHRLFSDLEDFILQNKVDSGDNISEFMVSGYAKNAGKILKAKNYVGVIKASDNTTIEILPKIFVSNEDNSYSRIKKIFLKMLKYTNDLPVKTFDQSSLNIANMSIFDIFIKMFLDEVLKVVRIGLKSSYLDKEDNLSFYKGKLLVNKHIINNSVNKHKFYVGYEEFSINRPENRLIKATLNFLRKKTTSQILHKRINECLPSFRDVEVSKNYHKDFSKCVTNRLMSHYDLILQWCKIFLDNKSFMNYKGENIAYSLLFPMEKVFEKYIAKCIMNSFLFSDYTVMTQHTQYYLIESHRKFILKPDLVMKLNSRTIVLDTKWKILDSKYRNNGISQSDLYQMYAYSKKYRADKVILIYPKPNCILDDIYYYFEGDNELIIFFIDLENVHENLKKLYDVISKEHVNYSPLKKWELPDSTTS